MGRRDAIDITPKQCKPYDAKRNELLEAISQVGTPQDSFLEFIYDRSEMQGSGQ